MGKFWAKLPLDMFTEHEANEDSSTVSTETICKCAEIVSVQYANAYRWRDGSGDLLAWAWESLDKLRNRGVPARAWSRALGYDFIDMLRVRTYYRSGRGEMEARTHNAMVIESQKYNAKVSAGDNGLDFMTLIAARRYAPDTPASVLSEFETELIELESRERQIIELLAEGETMWRIAERINVSESRVSQIIAEVCTRYRGRYPRGLITSDPFTPARAAHLARLADANRARARTETISENSDVPG